MLYWVFRSFGGALRLRWGREVGGEFSVLVVLYGL